MKNIVQSKVISSITKYVPSWMKNIKASQVVACLLLIAHVITLVPLIQIANYNVPSADDFVSATDKRANGLYDKDVSILQKLTILVNSGISLWKTSQGTFAASIIAAPFVLGEQEQYAAVSKSLICFFHISLFFMLWMVFHRALKFAWQYVMSLYVIIAMALVQMIPSVAEGFYWLSGATLYTGFFCLGMIAIGLYIELFVTKRKNEIVLLELILSVLCFLVGGGNFPTAVAMVVITAYALGYTLLYNRKIAWRTVLPLLFCLIGTLLNVLAPGNALRLERESVQSQTSLVRVFEIVFLIGNQFFKEWFNLPLASLMLVVVPLLVAALRHTKCHFHIPFIWIVLAGLGYYALYTPCAYSYGWIGPQRYMNIVYFGFIFMLFSIEVYVIGWLYQKLEKFCAEKAIDFDVVVFSFTTVLKKKSLYLLIVCILVFNIIMSNNFYFDNSISAYRKLFASESARRDMDDWQAQLYFNQYKERVAVLNNPEIKNVVLESYKNRPKTIYFDDITTDVSDWRNQALSRYYEKSSVVLEEKE